jgi:hypothetical protein
MSTDAVAYIPRSVDLQFARELLHVTRDQGIWGAPTSGLVYVIDHVRKTLTLRNPERLVSDFARLEHEANVSTFALAANYSVIMGEN